MHVLSTNNERASFFTSLEHFHVTKYTIVQLFLLGNIALALGLVTVCGLGLAQGGDLPSKVVPFIILGTLASCMLFVGSIAALIQYRRNCGGAWLKSRLCWELLAGGALLSAVGPPAAILGTSDIIIVGWVFIGVSSYYVVFVMAHYFFLTPYFAPPPTQRKSDDADESDKVTCCDQITSGACCCFDNMAQAPMPPPPWFAFPAFLVLTFEWSAYMAAIGLSAASNNATGGVGIVVAALSWIVASICLLSVVYGVLVRNFLLIFARVVCILLCIAVAIAAPFSKRYALLIFIPLALLGIVNEIWRRFVMAGRLEQEELDLLLPVHSKNAIEIPQLLEEATRSNWAIDAKDVRFLRKIGTGGFGEVWIGKWKGTTAAIKKMHSMVSADSLREFCREASILATLRHPHVISLYGAAVGTEDLMLVMEYAQNGSLYDLLHNPDQHLPFEVRMKMGLDAAKGMEYLHSQDPIIIHRDLKSLNLLVMSDMTVKVSDFGTSKWIQQTATMTANVGSAMWSAPEVLRFSKYSQQADIYSFAIVMWELMTRRDVFPGMLGFQIAIEVGTKGLRPELPTEEECPITEMNSLMQRAWSEDPHDRPSFNEIVNEMESILESMGGESHHSHC